ncbi:MAG: zinc metallopeptidase, partial [Ruminococcus sp.]|nr:zinc metallopeptidase [Ruminococcus sp.]
NECILNITEIPAAQKVLRAAAMTYVTSLVASILQLLRLLLSVKRR